MYLQISKTRKLSKLLGTHQSTGGCDTDTACVGDPFFVECRGNFTCSAVLYSYVECDGGKVYCEGPEA